MGFPFEHGLHSTLVATRLADRLWVDPATASQTYYACCFPMRAAPPTPTSPRRCSATRSPPISTLSSTGLSEVLTGLIRALPEPESPAPARALQVARRFPRVARVQRPHFTALCEVAQMLADGVGLPSSIAGLLAHMTERWDRKGPLRRAKGEEAP
jgi:hypothetical protein